MHSLASTAPAARPLRAGDDDPRPQLQAGARRALRPRGARHARARAGRGATLGARSSTRSPRARTSSRTSASARRRSTWCRWRRPPPAPPAPPRSPSCGRASAWGSGASCSRPLPSVRTRTSSVCCGRWRRSSRSGARCWCSRAIPRRTSRSCASGRDARDRLRRRLPAWSPPPTSRASTRWPRPWCSRRSTRASDCRARGDGSRRAGGLLGPLVAA